VANPKTPAKAEGPRTLPIPAPLLRHHGQALVPAMTEWRETGHVPPVLLITGTTGVGKRTIAHYLAQWILCERSGFARASAGGKEEGGDLFGGLLGDAPAAAPAAARSDTPAPCGECASCSRALHGNWIDFSEILPEDKDEDGGKSGTLKIDQFRQLKSKLGFGAHEGSHKITLIPDADRMTTQAANSVLKLLEEPPKGWLFFLTASDPALVLPTVLSRCQRVRLKPLSEADIRELLAAGGGTPGASIDAERAEICARLAAGSWGRALRLSTDEAWERRRTLFEFLGDPAAQLGALVDWASSAPSHFDQLVDQLEQLCADLVVWTTSGAAPESHAWRNSDGARALTTHARTRVKLLGLDGARAFWVARSERLARVRQEALAPLNRKLLAQDLLIPWLVEKK
jgi:DNA polymerase III delta prime subunit